MLTSCINGIAKNFKNLRFQSMDRLDHTLPLPHHTRRILNNWIMEAKEALSLWSPAEEAMEADIPLAGISSEEEAKDVASRLTDVSEQITEAMVSQVGMTEFAGETEPFFADYESRHSHRIELVSGFHRRRDSLEADWEESSNRPTARRT
jgi:hypothetical protein